MRKVALVLVLCAVSSLALSQPLIPKFHFGVHGNFTLANLPGPTLSQTASLGDAYGPGWGGGAHIDVNLLIVGFRLSADYMKYTLDQVKFRSTYAGVFGNAASLISVDGGGLSIFSLSANGKMGILPIPIVTPYLTGGIGMSWLSMDETKTSIAGVAGHTSPASSATGKTSVNIGLGTDISLGITVFAEVRYVWILGSGPASSYVPVTLGITF